MSKIQKLLAILTFFLLASSKLLHTQSTQGEQNLAYYDAMMAK